MKYFTATKETDCLYLFTETQTKQTDNYSLGVWDMLAVGQTDHLGQVAMALISHWGGIEIISSLPLFPWRHCRNWLIGKGPGKVKVTAWYLTYHPPSAERFANIWIQTPYTHQIQWVKSILHRLSTIQWYGMNTAGDIWFLLYGCSVGRWSTWSQVSMLVDAIQ